MVNEAGALGHCERSRKSVMRAMEITTFGGPDVFRQTTRSIPLPAPGEVLIDVHAAGVNRPDILQRQGLYPPPLGSSDIPGLEVAGVVVARGRDVVWPEPGDRVVALVAGGGYASHCLADAALCLPVPDGMDFVQAAGIPENWFTVWVHLVQFAQLQAGQSVLIHGGSSGIGIAAIQLAQALGARIFTTAGNDEKVARLNAMHAVSAVNYRQRDFVEFVRNETGGSGVDVIVDMVGGSYFARNIEAAGYDCRLALIGAIEALVADGIRIDRIMTHRIRISGNTLRDKPVSYKAQVASELRNAIWPMFEQGKAGPIVAATFPLEDVAEAHKYLESSAHFGKIILTIGNPVDDL